MYRNVARQLNISVHSETVVTDALLAVAVQIFSAGGHACEPQEAHSGNVAQGLHWGWGCDASLGFEDIGPAGQLAWDRTWFW